MFGSSRPWQQLLRNPRFWLGGGILLIIFFMAVGASSIAPESPYELGELSRRLAPPSARHWLGCDQNGKDVLTSLLYGARVSLYVSIATVFLSVIIGLGVGLVSGYRNDWLDALLMRCVDIVLAIPQILVALVLASLLGGSIHNVILAIAATGWAASARIVRGQVLYLRELEYVQASRVLGARGFWVVIHHILPGVVTPLLVHATFSLSGVIIIESSLSFLGLGAQQGIPSWGGLLGQGRNVLTEAPHLSIAPGIAIMLTVLAFNFIGDALRDAFDPRYEKVKVQ